MINTRSIITSLASFLTVLALLASGVGAWVNAKEGIQANATNIERTKDQQERIENKLDKIYEYLLENEKNRAERAENAE